MQSKLHDAKNVNVVEQLTQSYEAANIWIQLKNWDSAGNAFEKAKKFKRE